VLRPPAMAAANFVGSTADGWLEPTFVARIMTSR
jgi:hypothetical protein